MSTHTATSVSCANIAFIKYWGNQDSVLRIPANGSISMNLAGLETRTRVAFDPSLPHDQLTLNGAPAPGPALERVSRLLDRVRTLAGLDLPAAVESHNNFPTGAGIASSASAFAALAVAASAAAGLDLDEPALSRLARTASGSACRSVPGGFVEWQAGHDDDSSYAFSIASPDHWDLVDCVAIVSREHKATGSYEGHALAGASPLQAARLADAPRRLDLCRQAVCGRDFNAFAALVELDSNMMHAVIMTSDPPVLYWQAPTLAVMQAVQDWRAAGLLVCYTIDAGPNIHVLTLQPAVAEVRQRLSQIPGVESVLTAGPGGPARLVSSI